MRERRFGWATLFGFALRRRRGEPRRSLLALAGQTLAALGFALAGTVTAGATLLTQHDLAAQRPALYDLLVRPPTSASPAERALSLVSPDELRWGTGITLAQWQAIARLPGVAVAAPLAPLGTLELPLPVAPACCRRLAAPTSASGDALLALDVAGIDAQAEERLVSFRRAMVRGGRFVLPTPRPGDQLTPSFVLVEASSGAATALFRLFAGAGTLGGGLLPPPVDDYSVLGSPALAETPLLVQRPAEQLPRLPPTALSWLSIGHPAGDLVGVVDAARLDLGDAALLPLPFAVYGAGPRAHLPALLIDVRAACHLLGDGCISAVRVRVRAGAGPRRAAVAAEVARAIAQRTGLRVDITYGAAGRMVRVVAGGQGRLEWWLAKGATLAISKGINALNLLLFGLVCAVAALYTIALSFVSALLRGPERQILRDNGWPERAVRQLDAADTCLLAGASGLAALVTLGLAALVLGLPLSAVAVEGVLPLSMAAYATGAGLGAAAARWEQRRGTRVAPVTARSRRDRTGRADGVSRGAIRLPWWLSLAVRSQWRRPVHAGLAAAASGAAALLVTVLLLAVTALHGLLAVTLLGRGIAVALGPYHAGLAAIAAALAALTTADLAAQEVRDRQVEIGTLRALGATRLAMLRLVSTEASLAGIAGALAGVAAATVLVVWTSGAAIDAPLLAPALLAAVASALGLSVAGAVPPLLLALRITPAEAQRRD